MPLDFTAIDFETANVAPASACAVGLVRVRDSKPVATLELLFRPPIPHDWFSEGNIRVHGITPEHVKDAPMYSEVIGQML
ncbi:MAG: DNA polymerase III subunit epsilon, partial [Actinobacteria bacterium]|nr:DNA polymerase III subunit epsilon [Actinomycetota bacterium]